MAKITDLKTTNISKVKDCFYDGTIWTKNELALNCGLSLAATTNVLQLLLQKNEIKLVGEAASTGGRKSKQYIINPDLHHLGSILLKRDDQNYYFQLQTSNLLGKALWQKKVSSKTGSLDELMALIDEMLNQDSLVTVLALSIPGVVDEGIIEICDFDCLVNVALKNVLEQRWNLQVTMINDVNGACLGFSEEFVDDDNLALMYQPKVKYIGCGIMVNRTICQGFSNFAGELSYLPFYSHDIQEQLLKDNPSDLLMKQLVSLCCVVNPSVVGICSDVLTTLGEVKVSDYLPLKHCPRVVEIDDLDKYIFKGLYSQAVTVYKKRKREE